MKLLLKGLLAGQTKPLSRIIIGFLFAQAVWVGAISVGLAQQSPEVQGKPVPRHVIAAVPRYWPPQYHVDEDGNPNGFAIDVMEEVAVRAGLSVTYLIKDNFSEVVDALRNGDADLIPNSGILPERLDHYAFTAPLETFVVSLLVRNDTHDLKGVDDLVGRKLAVVEKNIGLFLFGDRQDIDVKVYKDVRTALYELLAGHVDALVYPESVILALTRKAGIEDHLKTVGQPLKEIKRGIRVRKDDVELLALLSKAVDGFVGTSAYQAIYAKWYGTPIPYWTVTRAIWAMSGFVAIVVVVMAGWRYRTIVSLNRALKESGERFRDLYDNAPDMYCSIDAQTANVIQCNQTLAAKLGFTKDEIIGHPVFGLYHPDSRKKANDIFREFVEDGRVDHDDLELLRKDGGKFPVSLRVSAVRDENGNILHSRSVWRDITERKRVEEARQEEQSRFRAVFDGSSAAITLKDKDGRFLLVNKAYAAWMNSYPSEITGRRLRDFFPKEQADEIQATDLKAFETGEELVSEVTRTFKDGVTRSLLNYKRPILSAAGEFISVATILTDITKRKQAEEELRKLNVELESRVVERTEALTQEVTERTRAEQEVRESEERTREILDNLADGAITIDSEGTIEYVNSETGRIFGYSEDELIDQNVSLLMPEPDRGNHEGYLSNYLKTGEARIIGIGREVTGLRKDGTTFPMEITIIATNVKGRTIFTGTVRDMTERKKVEQALIEAKLDAETASRVKTDFLANMSHELRTPLNAIIGFSDTMREKVFGPLANDKYEEYVDNIYESGEHLLELINDILDVSIIEAERLELNEERIDVVKVIDASIRLVKSRAEKGDVRLTLNVSDSLPGLFADERRIKQILLNLLSNAVKFTPEGGEVSLNASLADDGMLVFTIADTGIGMAEDEIAKAMEPFGQIDSSLNRKYEGTGLGLPVTKSLVEAHGGSIEIKSKPKLGTTVTVRFPAERVIIEPGTEEGQLEGAPAERKLH